MYAISENGEQLNEKSYFNLTEFKDTYIKMKDKITYKQQINKQTNDINKQITIKIEYCIFKRFGFHYQYSFLYR